jgi:hypothetical protein
MTKNELREALAAADASNNEGARLEAKINAIAAFLLVEAPAAKAKAKPKKGA